MQFIATALFVLIILTATDKTRKLTPEVSPIFIFVGVTALCAAMGLQGGEVNPARAFGPRLMAAIFYGREGE